MQSFQNYIDRFGLVKAELKCDQEPSTLDVANALIKRCRSTALILTATPKGSKGSLGRGERPNLIIQGLFRAERLIVLSEARSTLEKLCHLEKCVWGETILRMEPS